MTGKEIIVSSLQRMLIRESDPLGLAVVSFSGTLLWTKPDDFGNLQNFKPESNAMEKNYWKYFSGIIFVKLILAYLFPITSDEAYFHTWALNLDVNYYDHPPMTAWVVYLFSLPGRHIFYFRLFTIISGAVVTIGIGLVAKNLLLRPEKAWLISLAFLASPLHVLLIPITTDIPLFLFVFLSGVAFYVGVHRDSSGAMLLAGFLLSLAILSKYFAGLLMIGILGCLVIYWRRESIKYGVLLALGAAPMILLHLYWNYNDCWLTLMFNVFNRNKDHSLGLGTFLLFVAFQIYLATPWVAYYLLRNAGTIYRGVRKENNLFFYLAVIPMGLLALLSFFDTSLHWTISFYPFVYLMLVYVDTSTIRRIVRLSLIFSGLHILVVIVALSLPIETLKNHRYYADIVMGFHGDEIYEALTPYKADFAFGTPGYTTAALMAYHSGERFLVFNDDDRNGRNDDKVTNFSTLDGKNILILSTLPVKPAELADYAEYFDDFTVGTLPIRGADFSVVYGKGFRFDRYRELFLKQILRDCYQIPDYLPVGRCFFYDWYFPEKAEAAHQ